MRRDFRGQEKGRTIWIAHAHRDNGKRFTVIAEDQLTVFLELELAIRACDELPRQTRDIFPKLPGYENERSTNYNCTRLLCGRPKHAGAQSTTGRRLSRRQHSGGAKRSYWPHHRLLQQRCWYICAPERHYRQL